VCWIKYILLFGFISGFILGGIATYAEWNLNPQMEYTLNPEGLIFIFVGGFIIGFSPFGLAVALLMPFSNFNAKRRRKKL